MRYITLSLIKIIGIFPILSMKRIRYFLECIYHSLSEEELIFYILRKIALLLSLNNCVRSYLRGFFLLLGRREAPYKHKKRKKATISHKRSYK